MNKDDGKFYRTDGYLRLICKKCENRRMTIWRKNRGQELKRQAVNLLGGECSQCGYKKCMTALEFDHQNGDKDVELSKLIRKSSRLSQIIPELKKCILLCANCHRERHAKNEV